MRTITIYILGLFFLSACGQRENKPKITIIIDSTAALQVDVEKELLHFDSLKVNSIKVLSTDTIASKPSPLFVTHFQYNDSFQGFIIWENKTSLFKPIWFQLDSSSFPPHTFSYADFNNDGKMDLLILSGEEDEYLTEAYINYSTDNHYSRNNFVSKYKNNNDYSTIIDINQDGKPEILDSGHKGDEHNESLEVFLTTSQEEELKEKYDTATKNKNFNNFTYGVPEKSGIYNSFITEKVKIFEFTNDHFVDNTNQYKEHIKWRIKILTELKSDSRNNIKQIDKVITYLTDKIK